MNLDISSNYLEKLKRQASVELAKRSLLEFTRHTFRQYVADPAHGLIAGLLGGVVSGDVRRLMIFAPPQHGKSELASVRLPAFWLGKRPNDPIIISSYAASLAYAKSRHARNVVESAEYGALFPSIKTDQTKRAMNHWELARPHRASIVAAGVGGPITGHGAALGIIDDPIENWEQAQSEIVRDRVWEWWRGTFRTRVWENGAIVLMMTRWHEDDLAGRLLLDRGDAWTVVRLPAISETQEDRDARNAKMGLPEGLPDPLDRVAGEPLCPSRFSLPALEEIRRDVGSVVWNAEYQGAPTAPEGQRFKRAWLPVVEAVPAEAMRGRYWDLAATEGGGNRTAGVLLARHNGTWYVEDAVLGQWSSGERNDVMRATAELDRLRFGHVQTWFEEEGGSSGKDASRAIVRHMAGFPILPDRPTGSKDVRLEPFAAQAEAGNVKVVAAPWAGEYIDEMCAVPSGRYRDQADATAGAFNRMTKYGAAPKGALAEVQGDLATGSRWTTRTTPRWKRGRR